MSKVVRDGKVAVLVSPGYGAGWSTWNHRDLCFCPPMVAWVEGGKVGEPPVPEDVFGGGAEQLKIVWVDEGVQFKITEYDGAESIEFRDSGDWVTA